MKEEILEYFKDINHAYNDCTRFDTLKRMLGELQEPKTGHWILDETDNSITCDKCGCLIWANDISNGEAYYCPNCGAKMKEGSEHDKV